MAIDKNFLNELRMRLPLSAIIGQRVKLTRAGREFKACCPFHDEKSPSFYVNDDKGFFHCFGCGAHGDIVGFRMRYDNVNFREAVEALAQDAGLQVPADAPVDLEKQDHHRKLVRIMEMATLWFEQQLRAPANKFALDYLLERGLTMETISAFRLGYAPNNWDGLRDAMTQQNIDVNQLVDTGLLKQSEQAGKPPYSFFRGRIMFPVADRQGQTIAFGGRHLDAAFSASEVNSRSDYKPAKYMNSAEYSLFNKGAQLYSLSRARGTLKDQPLIIVEGYMDVIALHQAGFTAAVAPLGTALTEQQIQLAWHVTQSTGQSPVLCFDGDKAGLNAAYRALDRMIPFLSADRQCRFAFLPSGEDPDSLVKSHGAGAFRQILDKATTVFDVLWQRSTQQHGVKTPEDQARVQHQIEHDINLINDKTLQFAYGRELKDRLYQLRRSSWSGNRGGTTGGFGQKTFGGGSRIVGSMTPVPPVATAQPQARNSLQVRIMLAAVLNHPWLLREHMDTFAQLPLPDGAEGDALHGLQQGVLDWSHDADWDRVAEMQQKLAEYLSNQGFDPIVKDLLTERIYKHAGFARLASEPDDVLRGWHDISTLIQKDQVHRDAVEIRQQLAKDFNVQQAERLMALRQQQLQGDDDPAAQ